MNNDERSRMVDESSGFAADGLTWHDEDEYHVARTVGRILDVTNDPSNDEVRELKRQIDLCPDRLLGEVAHQLAAHKWIRQANRPEAA